MCACGVYIVLHVRIFHLTLGETFAQFVTSIGHFID